MPAARCSVKRKVETQLLDGSMRRQSALTKTALGYGSSHASHSPVLKK
jgi:hypothetical protein